MTCPPKTLDFKPWQALDLADEAGTDVVMVSPDAAPPVVRLIEVSKLKYEQEKAKKEAGRKSRAARCGPQNASLPSLGPIFPAGSPSSAEAAYGVLAAVSRSWL